MPSRLERIRRALGRLIRGPEPVPLILPGTLKPLEAVHVQSLKRYGARPSKDALPAFQAALAENPAGASLELTEPGEYPVSDTVQITNSHIHIHLGAGVRLVGQGPALLNVWGKLAQGGMDTYVADDRKPYRPEATAEHGELVTQGHAALDTYHDLRVQECNANRGFRLTGAGVLSNPEGAALRMLRAFDADVSGVSFESFREGIKVLYSSAVTVRGIFASNFDLHGAATEPDGHNGYGVTSTGTAGLVVSCSRFEHLRHAVDFSYWTQFGVAHGNQARQMTSWAMGSHPNATHLRVNNNLLAAAPGGVHFGEQWDDCEAEDNVYVRCGYKTWHRGTGQPVY